MLITYLFLFISILDFKNYSDGIFIFQILINLGLLVFGIIIIINRLNKSISKNLIIISLLISLSLPAFLMNGVETVYFLKSLFPYFLLFCGYIAGEKIFNKIGQLKTIDLLFFVSSSSMILTALYAIFISGINFQEMRYEILSSIIIILTSISISYILFFKKNYFISCFNLTLSFLIILVSATRGALLVYLLNIIIALSIAPFSSYKKCINKFLIFIFIVSLSSYYFLPNYFHNFYDRIFLFQELGFDITTETRLAEIDFQINMWLNNPITFLVGNGLGEAYGFSGIHQDNLVKFFGGHIDNLSEVNWSFQGHNFLIYSLFSQGILGAVIIPYILLRSLFSSLKNLRSSPFNMAMTLLLSMVTILLIVGNPMGSRIFAQYFGVLLGISFASRGSNWIK